MFLYFIYQEIPFAVYYNSYVHTIVWYIVLYTYSNSSFFTVDIFIISLGFGMFRLSSHSLFNFTF